MPQRVTRPHVERTKSLAGAVASACPVEGSASCNHRLITFLASESAVFLLWEFKVSTAETRRFRHRAEFRLLALIVSGDRTPEI
jgi:hypothetical protein